MPTQRFPDLERLAAALSDVFHRRGSTNGNVRVLDRRPNQYVSTFPTEIVTCRLDGNGSTLHLFVKYGTKEFDGVYGHRGDISYEAKVYGKVLEPLRTSTPTFYGVYKDEKTGAPWLVIEYLDEGCHVSWSRDPEGMIRSARWIGKFHAANEERLLSPGLKFLRRYEGEYYMGWARRASHLFSRSQSRFPWISPLCEQFEKLVPCLLEAPQTVIHGEYFKSNIVYQDGISRPVDWQSAAVGAGEIDLASLTLSRPRRIVRRCEREYMKSRWPTGPPNEFGKILEAARVYMNLRWLGDPGLMSRFFTRSGEFILSESSKKFIEGLYSAGESTGLIPRIPA